MLGAWIGRVFVVKENEMRSDYSGIGVGSRGGGLGMRGHEFLGMCLFGYQVHRQ